MNWAIQRGFKMPQEQSDYYDLQTELYRVYGRKGRFRLYLFGSVISGLLPIIFGIRDKTPIVTIVIGTLLIMFMAFFGFALSNLFWTNMNQSDYEERIVKRGVEYLSERRLSKKRIEIIGKRAEIGSGALSSRTILPLTAIPFLITYFSGKISPEAQLFVVLMLILIGLSFILELDRANMDVLIRQVYVSYIPPTREKKVNKKTE
jgi:uncharacterized membrane protein